MSGKVMGSVFDYALTHAESYVLLAMADHADHDGRNVRPRLGYVAWKTNYSLRQVRRIVKQLEKRQILKLLTPKGGRHRTNHYNIDLSKAPLKPPYDPDPDDPDEDVEEKRGQNVPFFEQVPHEESIKVKRGQNDLFSHRNGTSPGEKVTIATSKEDIAMSPQPSGTVKDEEPPLPPSGEVVLSTVIYSGGFETFWQTYPEQTGKDAAWKIWKRLKLESHATRIVESVTQHRKSDPRWQKGMITLPAKYLAEGRWKDTLRRVEATVPKPCTHKNKSIPDAEHYSCTDCGAVIRCSDWEAVQQAAIADYNQWYKGQHHATP